MNPKNILIRPLLFISICVFASCSKSKESYLTSKKESLNVYEVGGLKVKLPAKPKPKNLNLPAHVKELFVKFNSYEVKDDSLAINIIHVFSSSDFNIDGSIDGSVSEIKKLSGISSFSSDVQQLSLNGLPVRQAKITYDRSGFSLAQYVWVCADDREWWQIQIIADQRKSADVETLANVIFNSVSIIEKR